MSRWCRLSIFCGAFCNEGCSPYWVRSMSSGPLSWNEQIKTPSRNGVERIQGRFQYKERCLVALRPLRFAQALVCELRDNHNRQLLTEKWWKIQPQTQQQASSTSPMFWGDILNSQNWLFETLTNYQSKWLLVGLPPLSLKDARCYQLQSAQTDFIFAS